MFEDELADGSPDRSCILIAMPQLQDPNFHRSVSLIASFDDKGAFGVILNRLMPMSTEQLLADQAKLPEGASIPLHFGGPVQVNSLWFLHSYPEHHIDGLKIMDGIFLCTNLKTVEAVVAEHINDPEPRYRFFLGYSGWAPGQLEQEISQGSWVTAPLEHGATDLLFTRDIHKLWDAALARIGIHDPTALVAPSSSGAAN